MRKALLLSSLLVGFAASPWSGCLPSRGPCKTDNDCLHGQACVGGLCGDKLICADGKVCDTTTAPQQTETCTAGEKHCDGNTLKICQVDGKSWATLDCGNFHTCEASGCVRKPLSATCGNETLEEGEQCDDGNQRSGDGCSRYCLKEEVDRWEAPITELAPQTFVLGSARCRDAATRKKFAQNNTTLYITVSPVVCRENQRPIVSTDTIKQHIGFLNKVYQSAHFVFVLGQIRWEDDSDHCEVFYNTESASTLRRYELSNAISVFYSKNISGGSFSIGGFANLSGVVLNANAYKANEILAHELGHSFGLDHPHACYHGKETKESCETSGDQLCDTPADPGPSRVKGLDVCSDGTTKDGQCTVTNCKTVECPGGEKPQIDNLMSYYHCGTAMTADQLATVRCLAFHEQSKRVSTRRPCTTNDECGSSKCTNGFCESTSPTCTKHAECGEGLRCVNGQCFACVQDGEAAGADEMCCSSERNGRAVCCTKERCCGGQNHSQYTNDGKCRCEEGYTWTDPVSATDFRCSPRNPPPPSCQQDGMWAATDAACCSKERDDQNKCCTGNACCSPRNFSYTANTGQCQCQLGYEWMTPNDSNDRRCKKTAPPPCTQDGAAATSDAACCSKERNDVGKCCTGNGCCGPQNNSATASTGKCQCKDGFVWVDGVGQTDFRCKRPDPPSCTKDGDAASSDAACCSKERNDVGKCCTSKECCGPQNNSLTATNGKCQCKDGYTWEAPQSQNDYRCKKVEPPPCTKDGNTATSDAACCSQKRDDAGKCCSGNGCCLAQENAQVTASGACECKAGFERISPNDPTDLRCQAKPPTPGALSCTHWKTFTGHSNLIRDVDFSPDGKSLVSASYDKTLKLWDIATGKLLKTFTGHTNAVMSVRFHPNGNEMASAGYDRLFRQWNVGTGSFRSSMQLSAPVRVAAYSPNGQQVLSATEKGISLWNIGGGGYGFASSAYIRGAEFSPNGSQIALALEDTTVQIYATSNRALVRTLSGHKTRVFDVAYSNDGLYLASGAEQLRIWNAQTGASLHALAAHTQATFNVHFHPNSKYVFSAGDDNNIKLWDVKTGQLVQTISGHTGDVYTVNTNADGSLLASGSHDNTIRLWKCQ